MHDIWASVIQAALAGWMLYNRLGIVFLVPVGVVVVCSIRLVILMRFTGDSQRVLDVAGRPEACWLDCYGHRQHEEP